MKIKWLKAIIPISLVIVMALILMLFSPINIIVKKSPTQIPKLSFTVGNSVDAFNGTPDSIGVSYAAVEAALNMLPASGGEIDLISPSYSFNGTVSRPINNVIWKCQGATVTDNATTPLFSVGSQTGWVFRDLTTDAGGITQAADTILSNVTINTTRHSLKSNTAAEIDITGNAGTATTAGTATNVSGSGIVQATSGNFTSLYAPTGRTASWTFAASNSSSGNKTQANTICSAGTPGAEINAVLSTLSSNTSVCFLGGTYTLEIPIVPLSDQKLFTNSNALFVAGAVTSELINVSSLNDITIQGFSLNGASTCAKGIYTYYSTLIKILDVNVYGFTDGIYLDEQNIGVSPTQTDGRSVAISNSYIHNNTNGINAAGISSTRRCDYASMENNTIMYNTTGILATWCYNTHIFGNTINFNVTGISSTTTNNERLNIESNYIDHNTGIGASIYGARGMLVSNNEILRNNYSGLSLSLGSNSDIVTGNLIYGNGITGGTYNDSDVTFLSFQGIFADNIVGLAGETSAACALYLYAPYYAFVHDNIFINTNAILGLPANILGEYRNNYGYIAKGETRTYSGTIIGTASDNAALMLSIDNPFGQAVQVTNVRVEITVNASAAATMDAGVGSSATADYATIIAALPINPGTTYPYYYDAVRTATYGQMAAISGINWATGSGNRYLNFFNPSANASGTVFRATYTISFMGN